MAKTYEPIATSTLGSASNSVSFTGIPSTYTDLVLVCNWVENSTEDLCVRVGNGSIDTSSSYSLTYMYGTASSASGSRQATTFWDVSQVPATTTQFTTTLMNFQNYANSTTYKTMISRSGAVSVGTIAEVALWRKTNPIERIEIRCGFGANTFNIGSSFTLYGLKAA